MPKKGLAFHRLDDGELLLVGGAGEVAAGGLVECGDAVAQQLGRGGVAARLGVQILGEQGVDGVRQLLVRVEHPAHLHERLALGLAERLQLDRPDWRRCQRGEHAAGGDGAHQDARTLEELATRQG